MYVCMCVCVYVFMYVCMYVCMYLRMYVCKYVCVYVCMNVCLYVCMHVYITVCVCPDRLEQSIEMKRPKILELESLAHWHVAPKGADPPPSDGIVVFFCFVTFFSTHTLNVHKKNNNSGVTFQRVQTSE